MQPLTTVTVHYDNGVTWDDRYADPATALDAAVRRSAYLRVDWADLDDGTAIRSFRDGTEIQAGGR